MDSEVHAKEKQRQPKIHDIVALNEQLRRLNVIYMAGNMDDQDYSTETKRIKGLIEAAKKEASEDALPNIDGIREFLQSDFLTVYHSLSKEDQRRMWRSIIAEIYIDGTAVTGIKPRI